MVLTRQYGQAATWLPQLSYQRAWVEIDHEALTHNVKEIKQLLSPETKLMAVVKADAYGHGAVKVAETILKAGGQALAVATLTEGIELRLAGIRAPILILGGINTPAEVEAIAAWELEPTIATPQQALIFAETLQRLGLSLPVHLKLDTGMSRLGTLWQESQAFVTLVQQLPNLKIASVYSHLATADSPDPTIMKLQQQRYEQAIATLKSQNINPPLLHLANSAATIRDQSYHYDLVRVGLALYGFNPISNYVSPINLRPVMSLRARITQVKTLPAGTGVSYGYDFITPKEMAIAVVGIGYADGIPRNLSGHLQVSLRGQLVPQIGAITMDQLMIDVSSLETVQPGEIVTLLGQDGPQNLKAEAWANTLNTIVWEILCGFKHRLPRLTIPSSPN